MASSSSTTTTTSSTSSTSATPITCAISGIPTSPYAFNNVSSDASNPQPYSYMDDSTDNLLLQADNDPDFSDADSAYEGSLRSFGTTLKSSIYDYTIENGRRYHCYREGRYPLPCDDKEIERLDLAHNFLTCLHRGALFRAPLVNPKRVLDLGTGTGMWALEFGEQIPDCHVIGTDLSPIQPSWKPPNVEFIVDDFEDEWTWEKPFDFIHARTLMGSVKDWSAFFTKVYDNLAPGGYFQCLESEILTIHCDDGSYDVDGPHSKYSKKLREAARKAGLIDIAPKLKQLMLEAGFTEVKEIRNRTPTNKWPKNPHMKHLGGLSAQILGMGLEAYGLALFTRYLSMDPEEAKVLIRNAVADITNPKCHAIINQYTVYGRKPVPKEDEAEPERKRTRRAH